MLSNRDCGRAEPSGAAAPDPGGGRAGPRAPHGRTTKRTLHREESRCSVRFVVLNAAQGADRQCAAAGMLPVALALRCSSLASRTDWRLMSSPLAIATSTNTPAEIAKATW